MRTTLNADRALTNGSGSAQPQLPISALKYVSIPYFPLTTQQKIAAALSALDAKIELNNRINAELEAMAKTLYDYWFVQFDFPDENGKPYKSSGGKMVYNETLKRETPDGWGDGGMGRFLSIESGFPFKSSSYLSEGKFKIITIKNVQPKCLNTSNCNYINELPSSMPESCRLRLGDILISLTGDVARTCLVNDGSLLLNQRVGLVIPKVGSAFTYAFIQSDHAYTSLINIASGSNQKNLSPIDSLKLRFPMPSSSLIDKYDAIATPLFKTLLNNQAENQQLTQLRDWLLPMLMNGQVTVK